MARRQRRHANPGAGPAPVGSAHSAALRLLGRREYSRHELALKLGAKPYPDHEIDAALDQLEARGYLSDLRFAEMILRSRLNGGFGPVKIRFELREKGIPDHLLEQVLVDAAPAWPDLARQARSRRFGDGLPADLRDKARQARFLYARGFTSEQVALALDAARE